MCPVSAIPCASHHLTPEAIVAAQKNTEETAILYNQGLAKAIEVNDANDKQFEADVKESTELAEAQDGLP